MWVLIKLRLAGRARAGISIVVVGALFTSFMAWVEPALRSPERATALAASAALLLAFFGQTVVSAMDKREGRQSLHSALPLSRAQVAGQQIVEPLLAPATIGAVAMAAAAAIRAAVGGPRDGHTLLFIASLTAVTLTFSQLLVFAEEVQRLAQYRNVLGLLLMVGGGVGGAVFGVLLGSLAKAEEGEVPSAVLVVGDPAFCGSFLALAVLVAGLNRQLLMRRDSYVE
ncbi:MAG: hypothetical protein AAGF23_14980 [Acidobacteriota bacterium]